MYVSEAMTTQAVTTEPSANAREVASLLYGSEAGSIVVESDGPLGVMTETDIVGLVADGDDPDEATAQT